MTAKNPFDLTGRVALVTGGNGGLGRSMALGFANAGASVAIFGRKEAKNATVLAELQGVGVRAVALRVDMTNDAGARRRFRASRKDTRSGAHLGEQRRCGRFQTGPRGDQRRVAGNLGDQSDIDVPALEDGGSFHVETESGEDHQYRKHVLAIWIGRGSCVQLVEGRGGAAHQIARDRVCPAPYSGERDRSRVFRDGVDRADKIDASLPGSRSKDARGPLGQSGRVRGSRRVSGCSGVGFRNRRVARG